MTLETKMELPSLVSIGWRLQGDTHPESIEYCFQALGTTYAYTNRFKHNLYFPAFKQGWQEIIESFDGTRHLHSTQEVTSGLLLKDPNYVQIVRQTLVFGALRIRNALNHYQTPCYEITTDTPLHPQFEYRPFAPSRVEEFSRLLKNMKEPELLYRFA